MTGAGVAVWMGGRVVAPDEARVSVYDHGFVVGDGVFETMKVVEGRPFALRRHLDRLESSAARLGLGLPLGRARMAAAIDEVLAAAGPRGRRLRVTVTGGMADTMGTPRGEGAPTLVIAVGPLAPAAAEATAVTVPWARNERSALAGAKATSYAENVVALTEARKAGADEAVFGDTRGRLCEGTGTNVFVALGGRLLTPSLLSGCLAGVTRALLLEALPEAAEEDLPLDVLGRADEVLLTSTTRDVQPLRQVDGRPLPGAEGPLARRAAEAFADLVASDLDP